ncbi:hypothetical protein FOMPIDRAFT_35105, partial [Fomitopsis schrenkii]
ATHICQPLKQLSDYQITSKMLYKTHLHPREEFEQSYKGYTQWQLYEPRELVIVRDKVIEYSAERKQKPRYSGPHEIICRTTGGSYVLAEPNGEVSRQGIAASHLLPYISQ